MQKLLTSFFVVLCLALASPISTMAAEKKVETAVVHQININKAAAEELEMLPGIGQSIANQIVQYRTEVGPFNTADDLLNVKGIGQKTLDKIREMIVVK